MDTTPKAQRQGSDVLVSELPGLPGWTVQVGATGAITVTPASGERITQPRWRAVPIGTVLAAADELTREDRIDALVGEHAPLSADQRRPGPQRHALVARVHRDALAARLPPRVVVGRLYGVSAPSAAIYVTEARKAGAITDGSGE